MDFFPKFSLFFFFEQIARKKIAPFWGHPVCTCEIDSILVIVNLPDISPEGEIWTLKDTS